MTRVTAAIDETIFRAYDIRGRIDGQVTPDVVKRIAQAYATRFAQREQPTLVVSRDLRPSSAELAEAIVEGVLSTGVDVVDVLPRLKRSAQVFRHDKPVLRYLPVAVAVWMLGIAKNDVSVLVERSPALP